MEPAARTQKRVAFLVALVVNLLLLVHYHDAFWWPPDEGNYAHVAERILDGAVLHADVQDIHPGHINFVNAAAMAAFGRRLVSMRYPLIAAALVQALLVFLLLSPRGPWLAATASTSSTALGVIQFLNPTPHWYCLSLTVVLMYWLYRRPPGSRGRLEVVGFMLGTIFLFRQLTGVVVAMGTLVVILFESTAIAENTERPRRPRGRLALLIVGLISAGLLWYLSWATGPTGWVLFGFGPLGVLLHGWRHVHVSDQKCASILGRLAAGAALAVLPLTLYHAFHGSLHAWLSDAVVAATHLPRLPFIQRLSYLHWAGGGLVVVASQRWPALLSGAFWLVAPFLALGAGVLLLSRLRKAPGPSSASHAALPIIAVFYAVVSVHYAIPIYLYYSLGLSVVALLWIVAESPRWQRRAVTIGGALFLSAAAVYFQAGQPVSRGLFGIVEGKREELASTPSLPRSGLRVDRQSRTAYEAVVALIGRESRPDEAIAAIPSNAELYFLAERRNPFRFFNSALGVRDSAGLARALGVLRDDPPRLVLFIPDDKYNTSYSEALMAYVRDRYEVIAGVGPFEVYRLRDQRSP